MSTCCSTSKVGDAALAPQPHQRRGERVDDHRRQALERLVEQEQRGIAGERAADRQHLLLAARELVAVIALALGQAREEIVDALAIVHSPGRSRDAQILVDGERGENLALLRHEAEPAAGRGACVAVPARSSPRKRMRPARSSVRPMMVSEQASSCRRRCGRGAPTHSSGADRRARRPSSTTVSR